MRLHTSINNDLTGRMLVFCRRWRVGAVAALTGVLIPRLSAQESPPPPAESPLVETQPLEGPPAPPEFVILEGQITNHVGAGHPGVLVTVYRKNDDGTPGDVVGIASTDQFGDFAVKIAAPFQGAAWVACSANDYQELRREIVIGDSEYPPFLGVTLEGKLTVRGRVRDGVMQTPIAGANVQLKAFYREWGVQSDAEGRFAIDGVFPGEGQLIVEAEGFGRENHRVPKLEDAADVVIELKPQRIVQVKVVDAGGFGVSGVSVECWDRPRDDLRNGVTDDAGLVTFRGLHFDARDPAVRLSHADYVSSVGFDRKLETPQDQAESTHELTMLRAGRLEGRVTDAETGEALNGARISVGTVYREDSPRDWSNAEGAFAVVGLPPGHSVATVHLSGYAPGLVEMEIVAGQTATVNLALRRGRVVRGVCKDESGKPLNGVYVEAARWRGLETLGLRAVTDSDGTFALENAPLDEFTAGFSIPGAEAYMHTLTVDSSPIEVVLPESALVRKGVALRRKAGEDVPAVTLTTLDGEMVDLSKLRGKTVLVDFWATWCAPCVAEMPNLLELHKQFGARKDFVMIGVSLDVEESALRSFVREKGIGWKQAVGEGGGVPAVKEAFGVGEIPTVFLIDPAGKIVGVDLFVSELRGKIAELLSQREGT